MSPRTSKVIDLTVVAAVLVIAAVTVANYVRTPDAPDAPRTEAIADWDDRADSVLVEIDAPAKRQQRAMAANAYAVTPGGTRWPLTQFWLEVAIFTDFECPACRANVAAMDTLMRKFPLSSQYVIHYPLTYHSSAMSAATALECADDEGQGFEMYRALFAGAPEFGRRSWVSFAVEAQLPDTASFLACMASPKPRIAAGLALAKALGVTGTPTVVINGTLIHPSTPERIAEALERTAAKLAGR